MKVRSYFNKSIYVINFNFVCTSTKVRAFDLDSTLIETMSGNRFPKNATDYIWCKGVLQKLHELSKEGYQLVVFSNQKGAKSGVKLKMLLDKIEMLIKDLNEPIIFFLATNEDWNRKPSPGMWSLFINHYCNKVRPTDAMYIGDAAGRPNDFACSDRKFARNIGIKFQTPEEFFQNAEPEEFEWGGFDPQSILKFPPNDISWQPSESQEILLTVGFPGAGKSTWFTNNLSQNSNYIRINTDSPETRMNIKDVLLTGKSVYLDATNLSEKKRRSIIKKYNTIQIRCIWFTSSIELCKHLNKCRGYLNHSTVVPHVAYNVAEKAFVAPKLEEGFKEIIEVPFVPKFNKRELRVFKFRF